MERISKEFKNVEEYFFELDKENKKAKMRLEFDKPSDIFDINAITKTPVLSDDFLDWVKSCFDYAPTGYKIDLDISFDDLEGYKEEELKEIFEKNIFLEAKKAIKQTVSKNKIAIGLIIIGITLLVSMILLLSLWKDGGVMKDIISYIFDIATTVTLWEAMTILIVENKEKRDLHKNLIKKYSSISFKKREE